MAITPANDETTIALNATGPDRIDVQSDEAPGQWAQRFDVSACQIKDAVAAVGDRAGDVELHLKARVARRTTRKLKNPAIDLAADWLCLCLRKSSCLNDGRPSP